MWPHLNKAWLQRACENFAQAAATSLAQPELAMQAAISFSALKTLILVQHLCSSLLGFALSLATLKKAFSFVTFTKTVQFFFLPISPFFSTDGRALLHCRQFYYNAYLYPEKNKNNVEIKFIRCFVGTLCRLSPLIIRWYCHGKAKKVDTSAD